jgi:HAE1 family hydrophobic/amphiphilic exporter-1
MVMLIGLLGKMPFDCKFAIQRHAAGKSVLEAAMEGAKAGSVYSNDFVACFL